MDIEKIIELYKKYNNYSKVGKEIGINRKSVKKILVENKIDVKNINQHKLNLTSEDIEDIINMFDKSYTIKEIANEYDCNVSTIRNILNKQNISTSKSREKCNFTKYKLDEHYFDAIDDECKAYFIGFILADGCIYNNHLCISIQDEDKYILEYLALCLKSNHPIKKHYKYNTYTLTIGSKVLVEQLKMIGICERKSWSVDFDKIISNIPSGLLHHFVRGLFDGDGCIKKYKQTYYNKYFYHFSITGLKNVVLWCKEYLNIANDIVQDKRTKSQVTYYCLTRNTNTIKDVYDILYKNSTIFLTRKHDIFKEIL